MVLCSGKLLPEASAASPSATPPKTITRIKGKPSRSMISSRKSERAPKKVRLNGRINLFFHVFALVILGFRKQPVGRNTLLPQNAKLHQNFF